MRMNKILIGTLLVAFFAHGAQAVSTPNWGDLPPACTPNRMVPWVPGLSEDAQAPCHCPPTVTCPTANNAADFLNNNNLPPNVTTKCCEVPKCPSGTELAGQPVPANGDCTRPPACDNGFVRVDYTGPYSTGLGEPAPGTLTVDDVCGPPCDGNYVVVGNRPFAGGTWVLDDAWDQEGVPYGRFMHNGNEMLIACESVVTTNDCFHGSSKVTLADGKSVAIEALKVGDLVKGPAGDVRINAVNQLTAHAVYYRINDFDFRVTGEHPLQTKDGWKAASPTGKYKDVAGRLEIGDVLVTEKGEVVVKSVIAEKTKQPEHSVNIQTKDDAAFYVDGVAVKPFKDMQFTY